MSEFIGFTHGVYQACLLALKEDPFTGTLFTLVMIAFFCSPLILLAALAKGLQRGSNLLTAQEKGQKAVNDAYDGMHAEDMSGLRSTTGRVLNLILGAILIGSAVPVQSGAGSINPIAAVLFFAGLVPLTLAMFPGLADAPLKFLDRYLPWRGPQYRELPPGEDRRNPPAR